MGRFNIHAALAYTGIVAVAPVYTGVWMLLRTTTLPLPSKVYHMLDDMLYVSGVSKLHDKCIHSYAQCRPLSLVTACTAAYASRSCRHFCFDIMRQIQGLS